MRDRNWVSKFDCALSAWVAVARADYEQSQSVYVWVRNSCIAGVLLAALVGAWLVRAITRPLDTAVRLAAGMANGDLTQQIGVRSTDETGRMMQALRSMNESLMQIVSQVCSGTDAIANASDQIATGNQDL